ncbi:MAG: hypothetical protein ACJAZX_000211 [Rickettsiales bacterium]
MKLGVKLRQIHLLESPEVENFIIGYPIDGNNLVKNPKFKDGKVFINETQYFENVPNIAGYQPAQKWLKDHKGRILEFDDILHYQEIIVALFQTDKLIRLFEICSE